MFSLKIPSILLCILAGILTIIYPLTKRFLSVPQVFLGITYAMPVLIIGFEVSSSFKIGHFVFYLGNAFFIFAYDSIYAIQDKNDDLENQMNSSVIKFGHSLSLIISKAYNIAFILFAAFGFLETLFFGFYVSIIFSFIFIKKIIKNLDKKENQELQKIFELNLIPLGIIIFGLIIDIYFFSFFR
jgi:4-hydroxybenzoate polyprenyltransferase